MKLTLYGIPNCNQVKIARCWLDAQGLAFEFHDYKKAGVSATLLEQFLTRTQWPVLLNRKGTTWRKLPPKAQSAVIDTVSAMSCMIAHPSLIKRPILWVHKALSVDILVGFSEEQYQRLIH